MSICTAVLGGGGVLYWKQDKRAKEIQNEARQSEEWRKLYERSEQDSREKDAKIDALYEEKKELRERYEQKCEECNSLKLEKQKLEFLKCEQFDCLNRKPPRFFCENIKYRCKQTSNC